MQDSGTELLTKASFSLRILLSTPLSAPLQLIQDVIHGNKQDKEKQMQKEIIIGSIYWGPTMRSSTESTLASTRTLPGKLNNPYTANEESEFDVKVITQDYIGNERLSHSLNKGPSNANFFSPIFIQGTDK